MGFRDEIYKAREEKAQKSSFREEIYNERAKKAAEPPKTVTMRVGGEKMEVPQAFALAVKQTVQQNKQPFVGMENNLRAQKAAEDAYNKSIRDAMEFGGRMAPDEHETNMAELRELEERKRYNEAMNLTPSGVPQFMQTARPIDEIIAQKKEAIESRADEDALSRYFTLRYNPDFAEMSAYKTTKHGESQRNTMAEAIKAFASNDPFAGDVVYADTGYGDLAYDAINKNPEAIETAKTQNTFSNLGIYADTVREYLSRAEREHMTEEEVAIFNYLYAKDKQNGTKDAYKFLELLTPKLNARYTAEETKRAYATAQKDPVISSALNIVGSPTKWAPAIMTGLDYLDDGEVDTNSPYNRATHISGAERAGVSDLIEENAGGFWSGAYGIGMSAAENAYVGFLSGGSSTLAGAIMATTAFGDAVTSAKDRGLTSDQAVSLGFVTAAAELLTEKIGFDKAFDAAQSGGAKALAGAMVSNGLEEMSSEAITTIADVMIAEDKSEWQEKINKYKAQGFSDEEAFGKAFLEVAGEIGYAGIAGMASAGMMVGASGMTNAAMNAYERASEGRALGKEFRESNMTAEDMQAIISEGLATNPDSSSYKLAAKLQQKLDAGQPVSWTEYGKLYNENVRNVDSGFVAEESAVKPTVNVDSDDEKRKITPGFVRNEYSYDVSNKTIRALDAIGKKLGVEIEIGAPTGNTVDAYNGKYSNGKITIARDAENPLEVVLSHEVTHHMQKVAPAEYAKFVELAVSASTKLSGEDKSALIEKYRTAYSEGTGTAFSEQAAIDEITADYAGKLVRDVSLFRNLVNADRNVAQRFVDGVKRFISSVKSTFSKDKKKADTASLEKYGATVSELEAAVKAYEGMIKDTRAAVERGEVGADVTSTDAEIFGSVEGEAENTVGTDADGERKFSLKKNTDNQGRELSAEQAEYFKDSKVRDSEGNLLVLYHQTGEDFSVFDVRRKGAGTSDGHTPFGIFLKTTESDIGLRGKKQMQLYADIKNPLYAMDREDLILKIKKMSSEFDHLEEKRKSESRRYERETDAIGKEIQAYLVEWREANPNASRVAVYDDPKYNELSDREDFLIEEWGRVLDEISLAQKIEITETLKNAEYDGVILKTDEGSFGRKTDAYIALSSEQVKSVNNKTPTGNPDINLSLKTGDLLSRDYKPRERAEAEVVISKKESAAPKTVTETRAVADETPKGAEAPTESDSYLEETGLAEAEAPPERTAVTKEKKAPAPKKAKKAPTESGSYLEDSGFLDYYNEQERIAQGYSGSYFDETGLGDQFFTTDQRVQQERAKVQKEKEHTRERVSKIYSEQRKRELRGQILRATEKLNGMLLNPTDKKHIPQELQKPVANLLRAINLEGMGLEYGTDARYHRVDPTENPFAEPTKRTMAFLELKRAYEKIGGEDSTITISPELLEGDAEGNGRLFDKIIEMKDIPMYRMDEQQLRIVKNAISAVTNSVITANKLFSSSRMKTISDVADAVRAGAKMKNKRLEIEGLSKLKKLVTLDMMTPETYFHHLGDGGDAIFRMLRDAQDKKTLLTERVMNFASELVKDVKISELEKTTHDVVLGGEEMELSTAQIMELYLLTKREQAIKHIFEGGILPDALPGVKKVVRSSLTRGIKQEEVGRVLDLLSPEEKKMADRMSEFASSVLGAEMNEACLKVFGYEKFGEKNYWPIKSADDDLKSDEKQAGGKKAPPSIRNFGMANATKKGANTGVKLRSVFETFAEHASTATTYAAYLEAAEDLRRILNYSFYGEDLNKIDTIKGVVEKTFGKGGVQYWSKLDEDIAGGMSGDDGGFLNSVLGKTKAAAVSANLRVVLQQPTALLRAGDMIDYKYIAKGVAHPKRGWKRAVKYSPIAKWKSFGFFDSNSGPRTKDLIFDQSGKLEKIREWGMKGAEIADAFGWGSLWSACEEELRAKIKKDGLKLTPGSREFYEKVRRRFDEIIDHTQVVDGVLQRSQIMRSSNAIDKLATAFRAEPTKTVNMLMSAVSDLTTAKSTASRKVAAKRLARTAMSLLISSTITAALGQSIMDAIRDDDKEKDYWERWLEHFGGNMKAAVNPLQYYPYIGDVMSMIEGHSVGRYDMQLIEKVIKTARKIAEAFSDENKKSPLGAINDAFAVFGELFGLGTGNIKRDVSAIVSEIAHGTNNLQLEYFLKKETYEIQNEKNSKTFYDILRKAYETDKQAYEAIRADMIKNGYDEEEIEKKMKKPTTARSLDQAVAEARKAKSSKDATPADKVVYKHLNREKNAERGAGAATQEEIVNNLPTYRESVEKYLDEYPGADGDKRMEYAYNKANYEVYGPEYAIRADGSSTYKKYEEKVRRGRMTWEEAYDDYFGKSDRKYNALRDRFDISYDEFEKIVKAMSSGTTKEEEISAIRRLGYSARNAELVREYYNKAK